MLLEPSNYIFAREDKLPVDPKTIKRHLNKILKGLNIPTAYFNLRHSHVALLHHDKIDWQAISLRLGHKNLATTLKTYAYLVEEDKQKYDHKIVAKLERLM